MLFCLCFTFLFCTAFGQQKQQDKQEILDNIVRECRGTVQRSWGRPVANTSSGLIEGKYVTTGNGFTGIAFYGVPFGEKPAGQYRFAKSALKKPWSGRILAKTYGPACPQNSSFSSYQPDWIDEDCLWLAIYAPKDTLTPGKKYPVIYYIHGGNWEFDSNRMFPEAPIFENFVANGLIMVTVSYRMNALGFFSTGTADAPGNYGMLDMILGLEWVQQHISSFGGDPKKVTMMGHSSGGMAVSMLALSPLTDGLIAQAIPMSGSAFLKPSTSQDLSQYKKAAIAAGCITAEDWDAKRFGPMMECLRGLDSQYFTNAYLSVGNSVTKSTGTEPRIDGPGGVFPADAETLGKTRNRIGFLTGTTNVEFPSVDRVAPQPNRASLSQMCQLLATTFGNKSDAIARACTHHYDVTVRSRPSTFYDQPLKEMPADYGFFGPSYRDAETARDVGSKSFLYSFEYSSELLKNTGPYHAIDLTYIFGIHCFFPLDENDLKIRRKYSKIFSDFAIHGHPAPGSGWEPLRSPTGFNCYSINITDHPTEFYRFDAVQFWNVIVPYLERFGPVNENGKRDSTAAQAYINDMIGYQPTELAAGSLAAAPEILVAADVRKDGMKSGAITALVAGLAITATVIFLAAGSALFFRNRRSDEEDILFDANEMTPLLNN